MKRSAVDAESNKPDLQDSSDCLEQGRLALQRLDIIDAQAHLAQTLQLNPNLPEAWLHYGSALEKLGCYGDAIVANSNAQKLYANPGLQLSPPVLNAPAIAAAIASQQNSAKYWVQQGHARGDLGDYSAAIECFDRAIVLEPTHHDAWFGRSNALATLGEFEEAVTSYRRAAELNPQDFQVWNNFGYVWHQKGDYEQAVVHYDRALLYNPTCAPAMNNRGFALFHLGLYDTALAAYNETLALHPTYVAVLHNRGNALRALGRYEEAIKDFDQALALSPGFPGVEHSRSLALQESQQLQPEPKLLIEMPSLNDSDLDFLRVKPLESKVQALTVSAAAPSKIQSEISQLLQDLRAPNLSLDQRSVIAQQLAKITAQHVAILSQQDVMRALTLAEEFKDRCVGSRGGRWDYQPSSPAYAEIQTLLNPETAILYWHLSAETLELFVVKYRQPPQLFRPRLSDELSSTNVMKSSGADTDQTFQRRELDLWLKAWAEEYRQFCELDLLSTTSAPWRENLSGMLSTRLSTVLEIPQLCSEHLHDVKRLILIPDGGLCDIPLHVLFPEQTVSYLPSLKTGIACGSRPFTTPERLLSIEDPAASDAPYAKCGTLFPLLESKLISSAFALQPQTLAKAAATHAKVSAAVGLMSGVLRFTGSKLCSSTDSSLTAIALAGQDQLTFEDIVQTDLRSYSFVCLAGCDPVALDSRTTGSEPVSLVHGFLLAGTQYVVSTFWRVSGISTVLFLTEFYERLVLHRNSASPVQALTDTQCWLRTVTYLELSQWYQHHAQELAAIDPGSLLISRLETFASIAQGKADQEDQKPPFAHPFFWASFVVTGYSREAS